MKIDAFNITNFRRLHNVKIDIASEKTIFVGANNSGKTSAAYALKYFLSQDGRKLLKINDITLINHQKINEIGDRWLELNSLEKEVPTTDIEESNLEFIGYFPSLDILIDVPANEIHHVVKIIPSLTWKSGLLGVRLSYEPHNIEKLRQEYIEERLKVQDKDIQLWPCNLIDFLSKRMDSLFKINTYLLDINQKNSPSPKQSDFVVQGFNIHELIKFDFISAQRDISDEADKTNDIEKPATQIRHYYDKIINPEKSPNEKDIETLRSLQQSQKTFNETLESELDYLFTEIKNLGYPNIADPDIEIKTKIGLLSVYLDHPSVLNYKVGNHSLPENYLGLGFQNLIAMTVKLIKYRDEWLRIGKAAQQEQRIERLHFVIIEEPEAHLHAQAQQVFINNSYSLLTCYKNTKDEKIKKRYQHCDSILQSQLLVTTHSSHIVYEVDFANLRYFDRSLNHQHNIPLTQVKNLSRYFDSEDASRRFAARYLKLNHCDLFFADALVLLEGKAERLLIPQLIKEHFKGLYRRYISYIEIEGDYAHIFRPLLEMLGLDILIITDLDSKNSNGNKCIPQKSAEQTSSNPIINKWLFDGLQQMKTIDELMSLGNQELVKQYDDTQIYFAFQQEVTINVEIQPLDNDQSTPKKHFTGNIIPRTFEDALIAENLLLISILPNKIETLPTTEKSEIKKILLDLGESKSLQIFMKYLHARLNPDCEDTKVEGKGGITKAALALELLFVCDKDTNLSAPAYIKNGLDWLQSRLKQY